MSICGAASRVLPLVAAFSAIQPAHAQTALTCVVVEYIEGEARVPERIGSELTLVRDGETSRVTIGDLVIDLNVVEATPEMTKFDGADQSGRPFVAAIIPERLLLTDGAQLSLFAACPAE